MFHPIMNFFDVYSNKDWVLAYFLDVASSWWRRYGNDPDIVVTSRMPDSYAWYDMSVGFRALVLAFFADRISGFGLRVSDDDSALLHAIARKHAVNLSAKETFSLNNHGIFQAHGLLALTHTFDGLPDSDKARRRALDMMVELFEDQFDDRGIHREHSPHYHFYALSTFEAAAKSGWYEGTEIEAVIERARSMRKWLVDPTRRPVCIGDSILTEQRAVTFPSVGESVMLSDFDDSGYSVLRSGWAVPPQDATMVFLMGAFHNKTHKHRDCLSFEWFDRGKRIICDGGKYGYKNDKYRRYCLSSAAHNSVEIEGFDIIKMTPYGSAILKPETMGDGVYRLSAAFTYAAIAHKRHLYIKPGQWVIVEDELKYARARKSVQWFHLESAYQLISANSGSVVARNSSDQFVYIDCLDAASNYETHYGDEDQMQGFVSEKDYEIKPSLTVGFSVYGDDHRIVTCLSLDSIARGSAQKFALDLLGSEGKETISLAVPSPRNPLAGIAHKKIDRADAITPDKGKGTYSCMAGPVEVNFYFHRKEARKLLVMLPGASKRANGHIDFQRHTWSDDYKGYDVLVFSDPSLRPSNDIGLAWFQYDEMNYGLDAIANVLRRIVASIGYGEEDIIFFGSSGGGFGALQLASLFPEATAIAFNPQIYLYNYTRSFFEDMLAACYPGLREADILARFPERMAVKIDPASRGGPVYIFQNTNDDSHVLRHLKPFLKTVEHRTLTQQDVGGDPSSAEKINVVYFTDAGLGHSPPSRQATLSMIKGILAL